MANPREKFQGLLRKLFQFDCAELDFGIYRIMNHKRDVIEKFIEKDLLDGVAMELTTGALAQESGLAQQLTEVSAQIKENFGDEALDAEGNLAKEYQTTPRGKQYLELRERASSARSNTELETEIFNHLYAFFSRYYDEGDFMSLRRYSKRDKYAIPYNGEEVHLHWANADQYYIKTGENFTDYSYKHGGWTVSFKLRNASVEQNNVKGAKRFFLPQVGDVAIDKKTCILTVPFEYRPLTSDEEARYGAKLVQSKILDEAYPKILAAGKANQDALAALLHEKRKDSEGKSVTLLEHHLITYTRANSTDFFIHKDLKGFLGRELDFYIKNEILNMDEIEASGDAGSGRWFQIMTTIKAIGQKIIIFLAQIEDFERRIFEKKKFVIEAKYCITLDLVPEELYSEIIKSKAQISEWKRLYDIDEASFNVKFLKSNPYLMVDTRFFNESFSDILLATIGNFDDRCGGLIIKSENFQALNLLLERYRDQIKCIYIDPPYNTDATPIVYKNDYKDSSWLSMMFDRIKIGDRLLSKDGYFSVAIDDVELHNFFKLLETITNKELLQVIVNHYPGSGTGRSNVSKTHEYNIFAIPIGADILRGKIKEGGERERGFCRSGTGDNNYRRGRPNSFYAVLVVPKTLKIVGFEKPPALGDAYPTKNTREGYLRIYPLGEDGSERCWSLSYESAIIYNNNKLLKCTSNHVIKRLYYDESDRELLPSIWIDKKYSAVVNGTNLLTDLFNQSDLFSFPKSVYTVQDAINAGTFMSEDAIVIDFFAGSGTSAHAVINLNREDKFNRKYILVEVGGYFDSVLKPRIQKVIYSADWKDGKPVSKKGSSHIFKYMILESYEDALDNIAFQAPDKQDMFKLDDYVLSYMLDFETRQSETLLNVAKLDTPFDYKLKRHGKDKALPVDLPETFNYLIGLHVDSRRVLENKGNHYLVYRGKAENKQTVIIWRTTKDWGQKEFEQDRDFVLKEKLTDGAEDVFVNTDSFIPGARSLDPVFKHRMFNEE